MTTAVMIEALKNAGQDFSWYPTTQEMIGVVARHIKQRHEHAAGSILDIGAGDGRVLTALAAALDCGADLYAIEKAPLHIENMPANIAIVGTDFHYQTLIDKNVTYVFCNPPYSEFEDWAVKIIKEALCKVAYLILPKRWSDSLPIREALAAREAKTQILWSGDFSNAERKARASVDILCVSLCDRQDRWGSHPDKKDPFDTWFSDTFPEVEVLDKLKDETQAPEKIACHLIAGQNLVERLAELYRADMDKMYAAYRSLCSIDPALLKTVGVKVEEIKAGLKEKIKGLKNLYWQELFDHLDKVTARLTSGSREAIVQKMASAVHVDFTVDNAYAVVLWVLKNANQYIDSQLVGLFRDLSRPENVKNYKSNQRTWDDERWRYLRHPTWNHGKQETPSRYMLEYRIVAKKYNAIGGHDSRSWDYEDGLHKDCHAFLQDVVTVSNNLGFPCTESTRNRRWISGGVQEFCLDNGETLMRVRAFMNGNLHLQLHQGVIKALNVEASRLLGWIHSPREAAEEMSIDFETAQRHFGSNKVFVASEYKRLTA